MQEELVKKEERIRRKREKDSVRKSRKRRRDLEQENKKRKREKWEDNDWYDEQLRSGWTSDNNWAKSSKTKSGRMLKEVKNENVSRSRSRSQERKKTKKEDGKGKKSVVSKHSRASEFLHNAWGTTNQPEETWDDIKDDKEEDGCDAAKSEIKTETDWGKNPAAASKTKDEDWENWNEEKSVKTNNDATSNW